MRRRTWFAIAVVALASAGPAAQSVRYIDGVFVSPHGGAPVELIANAEQRSIGTLRMTHGALEDAPYVHTLDGILASLPNWQPVSMTVTTAEIFTDERAERRTLPFAGRRMNVYAVSLRVVDLETRDRIEALLRSVRASADNPGYALVGIQSNGGLIKYYPFRLTPPDR